MQAGTSATTAEASRRRIDLLPNCSLTTGGAVFFFAGIATVSLTVAGFFVMSGYWPVLPFAGLELGLLAWALSASMKRRHWTQSIEIDGERVVIETHGPTGMTRVEYPRYWASVKLTNPPGWTPARLLIVSHGRSSEVGAFLTEEERRRLYERLLTLVGRTSESPRL